MGYPRRLRRPPRQRELHRRHPPFDGTPRQRRRSGGGSNLTTSRTSAAPSRPPARATAVVGALAISFSAILYRLSETGPITAGFFRMLYALPVLVLVARVADRTPTTRRARLMALAAGTMLGLDVISWQMAVDQIGAGLATLVVNSQVIIVPIATWVVLGERPSRRAFAAMPVVMVGLAAVTGLGSESTFGARPVLGVFLGIGAAGFYSAFLMVFRRAGSAASEHGGGAPIRPLSDATLGALVVIGAVGLVTGDLDVMPTWPAHGWLIVLAVGSQVLGWLAIGYALSRLPAAITSFVIVLQPALTLFWAFWLFGERPNLLQLGGVALVVGGIGWAVSPQRGAGPRITSRRTPTRGPSRR